MFSRKLISYLFQVNEFLAGAGTDAPDVEENIISRTSVSYDDMWAKTILETSELDVSFFLLLVATSFFAQNGVVNS